MVKTSVIPTNSFETSLQSYDNCTFQQSGKLFRLQPLHAAKASLGGFSTGLMNMFGKHVKLMLIWKKIQVPQKIPHECPWISLRFFFHLIHFPSKFFCFHISAHVSFLMPPWRWPSPWRWPLQLTLPNAWSKASRELFINSTGPRMFLVNLHSLQKGSFHPIFGV